MKGSSVLSLAGAVVGSVPSLLGVGWIMSVSLYNSGWQPPVFAWFFENWGWLLALAGLLSPISLIFGSLCGLVLWRQYPVSTRQGAAAGIALVTGGASTMAFFVRLPGAM